MRVRREVAGYGAGRGGLTRQYPKVLPSCGAILSDSGTRVLTSTWHGHRVSCGCIHSHRAVPQSGQKWQCIPWPGAVRLRYSR